MKKVLQLSLSVLAIAAILGLNSCDKIKSAVTIQPFDFTGGSADIVIPVTAAGANGDMGTETITLDIDSLLSEETKSSPIKVKYSDIKSIKVTSVVLTLSDADINNNFGNFEIAEFTFNTDANGTTPYTLVSTESNPAVYSAQLTLPLVDKDKDLKQYFADKKVQFTYAVTGKLRTATTHPLHCHVDLTYEFSF